MAPSLVRREAVFNRRRCSQGLAVDRDAADAACSTVSQPFRFCTCSLWLFPHATEDLFAGNTYNCHDWSFCCLHFEAVIAHVLFKSGM